MAGVTTSDLSNALETVDLPKIFDFMINGRDKMDLPNNKIWTLFGKKPEKHYDEEYFTISIGGPEAFGPHTEGGTVNRKGQMIYGKGKVTQKKYSGGFEITYETIKKAQGRGIDGAKEFVKRIMEKRIHSIDSTMDYHFASEYSDGSGKLAQCNGAGSGTATLIVDNPGIRGQFRPGMYIDIYLGAVKEVDGIRIEAVDPVNNTLTLASNQTWTDDAYVYPEGCYNGMFDGLISIVNTTTFENIDPSTYPHWKAWMETATGAFEFADVDTLLLNMAIHGDTPVDMLIADTGTLKKMNSLNYAARTLQNVTDYKPGFALTPTFISNYGDLKLIMNKYWITPMIFAINSKDIGRAEFVPLEWFKHEGNVLIPVGAGKIDYEAKFFTWMNYLSHERWTHGKVSGYTV